MVTDWNRINERLNIGFYVRMNVRILPEEGKRVPRPRSGYIDRLYNMALYKALMVKWKGAQSLGFPGLELNRTETESRP